MAFEVLKYIINSLWTYKVDEYRYWFAFHFQLNELTAALRSGTGDAMSTDATDAKSWATSLQCRQSGIGGGGFFNRTRYIFMPRYLMSNFLGTRPTE